MSKMIKLSDETIESLAGTAAWSQSPAWAEVAEACKKAMIPETPSLVTTSGIRYDGRPEAAAWIEWVKKNGYTP